ncbi:hypothetical protein [Parasitella parasitica]|uniref:Reverse transcriptase domain-containing protein n=1 Tax=Parasitella parasitica TaxID=35722 RepID=A0A0B7NNV3_9FUNG|nr:hypothetical protein [Parasitella parasitica]
MYPLSSYHSLGQTLCPTELCTISRRYHQCQPTLAFLDIKSAYDTVGRSFIWRKLQPYLSPALLGSLRNLFDNVQIEVLINNTVSSRFLPVTDVLQGSILSPFLHSIYINDLPNLLRPQLLVLGDLQNATDVAPLYADDMATVVIVASAMDEHVYTLSDASLPHEDSFSYLGISIKPGGSIDVSALVHENTTKARKSMNQIAIIGVNAKGFNHLLFIRFHVQMIRSQLEYGLAISTLSIGHLKKLEACQTECNSRIFGDSHRSSPKVMMHLVQQPSMTDRARILQTKFLIRSLQLPDDTLLQRLLSHIKTSASRSTWYKLTANPLWKECFPVWDVLDRPTFNKLKLQFFEDSYEALCAGPNLTQVFLRWRLGWLPGGIPRPCVYHPLEKLTRKHGIECLDMHSRLQMPLSVEDHLSYVLNHLPVRKS